MLFVRAVHFFLPPGLRDSAAPRHQEFRVVISTCLIALPLVLLFPLVLFHLGREYVGFLVNAGLIALILLSCRLYGHYRIPMTVTALATYYIIYGWIRGSGLLYSPSVSILHMYLLGAIWTDKRYGWWVIFTNLAFFCYLYVLTVKKGMAPAIDRGLGDPGYALAMNGLITVFFGGFLAYLQLDQERDRMKIRRLQEHKIGMLDQAVRKRTEQLASMRENIATDFHDETGNMLSAITRQATQLRGQLEDRPESRLLVESIIVNSNRLYATSKDFLWHLNHDSDDPYALFGYLTEYGQWYYNQFDIAFSSDCRDFRSLQLGPSAALQLIYIFKEAMTNVVKHAGAREVVFSLHYGASEIVFGLRDDGRWREADRSVRHYGLDNMSRRCVKNGFLLEIAKGSEFTEIAVRIPLDTNSAKEHGKL